MELEYVYTKFRSEFGKQCLFSDKPVEIIDQCKPNSKLLREYINRNPVNQYSECSEIQAEHLINTESAKYVNSSMNHSEGGWPKDVNLNDEEQPKRYRRKIEKEEIYVSTVLKLANNIESFIIQNTSVNIYKHYFTGLQPARPVDTNSVRTVNAYEDPSIFKRPITNISWSPNTSTKLAIAYCDMNFQPVLNPNIQAYNSYIWEVENPNMPQLILKPPVPLVSLEYHLKDTNCLVAGMLNGQVSLWDARRGYDFVNCSVIEESHQDPVRSVIWINSKTGSEFFSGSSDGQCKWWDIRKLSEPTENLILDMVRFGEEQQFSRAQGVSCLEYEPTIPTRFMVGTEHGCVMIGNRKGKNAVEKLVSKFHATTGPVYSLERNAAFSKIFMTVGDCMCKIWSEEVKDNCIISIKNYNTALTGARWSPARYSVFYLTRYDGFLDIWDILQTQKSPMMSVKLSEDPLTCIRSHEMGQLLVIGNQKGTTFLVEVSDNFCLNQSHEKVVLGQMFDRETLREKIMESKLRELKLRTKSKSIIALEDDEAVPDVAIQLAEEEFYKIIEEELNPPKSETTPPPEPAPEPVPEPIPEPVPVIEPKKGKGKGKKKGKK